jgi:hypothetical protein
MDFTLFVVLGPSSGYQHDHRRHPERSKRGLPTRGEMPDPAVWPPPVPETRTIFRFQPGESVSL